jgi:hypothetical protein
LLHLSLGVDQNALIYPNNSIANWIVQHKRTSLSKQEQVGMGLGMNGWHLRIWLKDFIERYETWSCAMMVELNQHHNSKGKN